MPFGDDADDEEPGLVSCASRDLNTHLVEPQRLGLDEVDTVLRLVGFALAGVEFKVHVGSPPCELV